MRDSMKRNRLYNDMNIISHCLKATERESKPLCKLVYSFLIVIICLSFLEITVKLSEIMKKNHCAIQNTRNLFLKSTP